MSIPLDDLIFADAICLRNGVAVVPSFRIDSFRALGRRGVTSAGRDADRRTRP
jgi:hypothetical protein